MVKKISILFAVISIILSIFVSKFYTSSIKDCYYTFPSCKNYSESVYANGTVVEKSYRETFVKCPVVADKIFVKIGDKVNKGDKIAEINIEATENLLKNSVKVTNFTEFLSKIPPEIISEATKKYGIDIKSAVSAFNFINSPISNLKTDEVIPKTILAQQGGTITELNLVEGNLFSGNKSAVRISDTNKLFAQLYVSEEDINKVNIGDDVILKSVSDEGSTFHGTVKEICPVAEKQPFSINQISSVKVIVEIDSPCKSLKPNFNVRGKISIGNEKKILTIPYDAVFEDEENKEYVFVLKNGKAEKTYIQTGIELSEETEAKNGIEKDDILLIGNKINNMDFVNIKGEFKKCFQEA